MLEFIENNKELLIWVGIGLLAFIVLLIILSVVVFRPLKFKKQMGSLDREFQYTKALLIGQDTQYIKRLEIISMTNLLYVETHTSFSRRYKEIRDRYLVNAESSINKTKDFLDDRQFSLFKESFIDSSKKVEEFSNVVNRFTSELSKVIKPEEDCRQAALEYKNQLRGIKQEYYSKESELALMNDSFEEVFKNIDGMFADYEECIDSAHYDDANAKLPEISAVLHELTADLQEFPTLCALIANVVPEKIHEVEIEYKELIEEHYPLHHLFFIQTIEKMNKTLKEFTERIRVFDTQGMRQVLDDMISKLEHFLVRFDEEKEARALFDAKNTRVYELENSIERRYIKLRNTIPEVSEYFVINSEHTDKINELQADVNKLGVLKRALDTYIHSSTKQPYSLLVSKMKELDKEVTEIVIKLDEFDAYLESLKNDAENAYALVYREIKKVREAEETVREMYLESVTKKYSPRLEQLFSLLDQINLVLVNQPIDVDKVNELIREYSEVSNELLDNGQIAQDKGLMSLAESAINCGNKHRNDFVDIDQLLSQAESFFESGDFEKANEVANQALTKIKQKNGK